MIAEKNRRIYSEVAAFLNIVDEEKLNRIPQGLRKIINEEKMQNYMPQYKVDIPIEEQNISNEAIAMIGLLHLNYWCTTKEEKEELNRIFNENEKSYQEELRQKYDTNNIFKNDVHSEEENTLKHKDEMIVVKETFYEKILKFIKRVIKI